MVELKYGYMNKKGIILELGALILVIITTIGAVITISGSKQLYVGDDLGNSSLNYYLDYYKCKEQAKNISEQNLIVFKSEQEAKDKYFNPLKGCT